MSEKEYYQEIEFKEIQREKKVRKKKHYLARFLIFVFICIGIGLFLSSDFFSIKKINVTGNRYYTDEEVINMADAQTGGNLFWGAGDGKIKDRLLEDAYFSEVKLKRTLPSTITIEVVERKQVAAIAYGDKYVVIDDEGVVLRKSTINPKLTLLKGLTISKMNVGENVEAEEETVLSTTLNMLGTMEKGDIFFKRIDVSQVTIKAYIYDTLLVKGTPKQMLKAIESGDLQKVINNLFKNDTTRGTINLGNHNYMSFSPTF